MPFAARISILILFILLAAPPVPADPPTENRPSNPPARPRRTEIHVASEDPAALQRSIEEAARGGFTDIVIPAGTYRLGAPRDGRFYLRFAGLSGVTIDAAGVTLLRTDPRPGGVLFENCRDVTLTGLTLVNETPPFTQGTIEAIAGGGASYDLRIDAGYPTNFDDPRYFPAGPTGYPFDAATRQWKAGTADCSFEKVERLGPDRFRLTAGRPIDPRYGAAKGDLMAFRGAGNADVRLGNCSGMTLSGLTIKAGTGFCVHEDGGEGGNAYHYAVTYGPRPAGATADPLMACDADAFHSSNVRRGPTVSGCRFEGMPDDGIAVHGRYALVTGNDGKNDKAVFAAGAEFFRPGDPLRLFDARGEPAGEAVVKAVAEAKGYEPAAPIRHAHFKGHAHRWFRLELDRALAAGPEFLAGDPAANGSGYVLRDNDIRNHRARGMLLKADDGLVENNRIDGSTIAGIVLAPELWWNEACYSRNVTLRGNAVRHVGYAAVGPWTDQAGAITLLGADLKPAEPAPAPRPAGATHAAKPPPTSATGTSSSRTTPSRIATASRCSSAAPRTWPYGTTASSTTSGGPAPRRRPGDRFQGAGLAGGLPRRPLRGKQGRGARAAGGGLGPPVGGGGESDGGPGVVRRRCGMTRRPSTLYRSRPLTPRSRFTAARVCHSRQATPSVA